MSQVILSCLRFEPESSDLRLPGVEPDFILNNWHKLKAPRLVDQSRLISYFAHQISRQPSDLLSHTRRIIYHVSLKDRAGIYGALLDLYLALGNKGAELRACMLEAAKKFLSDDQRALFSLHQHDGIYISQPLPPSTTSILGNFFAGTSQLFTVNKGSTLSEQLKEMDDYLNGIKK